MQRERPGNRWVEWWFGCGTLLRGIRPVHLSLPIVLFLVGPTGWAAAVAAGY